MHTGRIPKNRNWENALSINRVGFGSVEKASMGLPRAEFHAKHTTAINM
jgi:hypothetical protein